MDRSIYSEPSTGSNSSCHTPCTDITSSSPQNAQFIQQALFDIKAQQEARQEAVRLANEQQQRIKQEASEARMIARMQQFLTSDDPILIAEALAWAQVNPGILTVNQRSLLPNSQIEVEGMD